MQHTERAAEHHDKAAEDRRRFEGGACTQLEPISLRVSKGIGKLIPRTRSGPPPGDGDAADRTHRPEELSHALYPRLLLISAVSL
jgi:hypothetical protein